MLTQIVTFLIFFAVIGCILYGRRLIKTEKVDAVFGNPERARGGTHWIIVGSSFLLLVWLYYSWDIAKGFYPKSANELCQVAKVNDSLLGLKYQFPIEEREFKSTAQIKKENKNLKILGGIMGADVLDVAGVQNVATLPSLDEARAKIVGILRSPAQKIASILLAPASKIAILALEKSKK